MSVEIGNTDAEGRLILADSLALADEESPELIIDMATLTGAARVAVGPEIVPFFSTNEVIANDLKSISKVVQDPVWELPYFEPYEKWLSNDISDLNNSPSTPFAGSIVAAEFLKKFVNKTDSYWKGDCFVFDNRVSIKHSLKPGNLSICAGCREPITKADTKSKNFEEGVSCPNCYNKLTSKQLQRFRMRQKQIKIAKKSGKKYFYQREI